MYVMVNISTSWTIDDHCRVVLKSRPGDKGSDYINASFVDVSRNVSNVILIGSHTYTYPQGYYQKAAYIVTQGPLQDTCDDFWRMIWEKKVALIVMLTKLTEKEIVSSMILHNL